MASRLNKNSNADEGAKGKKPTDPPTTVDAVTRGRWEPVSDTEDQRLGWGVVRLYRDAEETAGLYQVPTSNRKGPKSPSEIKDEDCTVLCILAVPSYLTPSDFLGFVGEKTRVAVSHFRMIRTERSNRYMVLMKFRHGKTAREWRSAWNGRSFDGMEPENCHVVFVKSVEMHRSAAEISFPDMTHDPFTPTFNLTPGSKPLAPPTPALVELPTCPVCLERMDESTGLLTILCQHVFHCSCLQKWRGSGCPVCRYVQGGPLSLTLNPAPTDKTDECSVCHLDHSLWICLICGNVACGRYEAAHAFAHYAETAHCFSMDMDSQRVWDYASDGYVHRLFQDKYDGKFIEAEPEIDEQSVSSSKLQTLSREYTTLLTSQLDSQRQYYSSLLQAAADKASHAAAVAETLTLTTSTLDRRLQEQASELTELKTSSMPDLQKDRDREARKAAKYSEMARRLEKEWKEEQALAKGLTERIGSLETRLQMVDAANVELKDQARDLMFMLEGRERVQDLEKAGLVSGVEGGDVVLPTPSSRRKRH